MKQEIRLGAIIMRDGRLLLQQRESGPGWELPGGPLPAAQDDMDAEMDAILARIGVSAPAVEEDFVDTVYLPTEWGQVVYNVYAPTEWTGEPSFADGRASEWFTLQELDAIDMEPRVREAILVAFGVRDAPDEAARILSAIGGGADIALASHEESRFAAGLDVLGTLSGGNPDAAAGLRGRYPELGDDVVSALGGFWTDPALDRRTRSLMVVAMLAATGKAGPLRAHIAGALNHGASAAQVIEAIRMVAVYAGFPAALEAWPVMEEVFAARGIVRPGSGQ